MIILPITHRSQDRNLALLPKRILAKKKLSLSINLLGLYSWVYIVLTFLQISP
jgi:hypothetical protein